MAIGYNSYSNRIFTQLFTSQTSVVVTHNLGYHPLVSVEDSSGNEINFDCQYNSNSQFTVTFLIPQSGVIRYR